MPSLLWPGVTRNWVLLSNMGKVRTLLCMLLCLLLLVPVVAMDAGAEESARAIMQDLIAYYFHYRDRAEGEIENQLQILSSLDPQEGELWREIMRNWAWINEDMTVNRNILPDGLPQDDSLCIVVLGYGLNRDGSMKDELIHRLEVALRSAEKYPESYILCTGGETAGVSGISEAGQMGAWLLDKGLDHNRLIQEDDSLSTTANAQNSCAILWRDFPQVSSIAIVSSDYHIRWGSACFSAMASCGAIRQGKPRLRLVGNAGCVTDSAEQDTMYSQAWGLSIITDIPFDSSYVPTLYMSEAVAGTEPEPLPLPAGEPVQAEPVTKEPVAVVLLGLAAAVAVIFLPKRRKKSK